MADAIDDCAKLMQLYRLDRVRPGVRELARVISRTRPTRSRRRWRRCATRAPSRRRPRRSIRLDEGDVHEILIVKLFDNEKDPIQVIKWKELYEDFEAATDRCEDIANVLDGISVKHA